MNILGVLDGRSAAVGVKRLATIDRARADTDRGAVSVSRYLHGPVEDLLYCAGGPLNPRLPAIVAEELGRLDDRDLRVLEVWQRFGQQVRTRSEVGVQDDYELPARLSERVPQVPAFFIQGRFSRTI